MNQKSTIIGIHCSNFPPVAFFDKPAIASKYSQTPRTYAVTTAIPQFDFVSPRMPCGLLPSAGSHPDE